MRIIHWYSRFLAGGAIAETVLGLANAQALLGHQVLVVSRKHENNPAYNSRLSTDLRAELHTWEPVVAVTVGRLPASLIPLHSVAILRKYEADILHIHNGIFLEDALARQFTPRARAVLTPHGAFYPQVFTGRLRAYVAVLKPFFYSRLAAFHAVSPDEAKAMGKVFPSSLIYTVPSGLSSGFQAKPPSSSDREDGMNRPTTLVCVGRLDIRHKGLDILLHAFAHAALQSPQRLELLLVGPRWGSDYASIVRMIDQLGIEDRVLITGATDHEGVAGYLKRADIFIQMSRWEAFSLAAVEAMALELPCILSSRIGAATYPNIASLPQLHITEPDVEQVTVAILDVAHSLRTEREAARRFGSAAREFFSWERAADEHERAYCRLIST